jgi:pyrroline-5-carboxylate reductase
VSNIETRNQKAEGFRMGLLGAGRLGDAIAKVWLARTGDAPLVWSRSGRRPEGSAGTRIDDGAWVADWTETLRARSLFIAIPGRALLDLAEGSEHARTFGGNIFSAAVSLSQESLRRVFPRATSVSLAPFLIDDTNSIPMLALRPPSLPDPEWERARTELYNFGDVDVVQDEELFARISLLGASWPVVVLSAIQAAARVGVQGVRDEAAIGIGQRLFFRAMQAFISIRTIDGPEKEASGDSVATPGGITERGLKSMEELTGSLTSVFDKMQARADELRA